MRAKLNGTTIFFDIVGSGLVAEKGHLRTKPTIIVLHGGLGFDHGYLRPGLTPLSEVAQIVFIDLRGQGRSGRPPLETCTFDQMADDVASLCRHLGVETPIVFGHSAGGFVAMHLALRYPTLISGLILCGSTPAMASLPDYNGKPAPSLADRASPEVLATAGRVLGGDITEASIAEFFQQVGPYYVAPNNMENVGDVLGLSVPDIGMMRHFMTTLAPTYDLRSMLEYISAPTLVLVGSHDWACPPRASHALAGAIPNAEFVEFFQSGHLLFSEEPEKFHEVVSGFVMKHSTLSALRANAMFHS